MKLRVLFSFLSSFTLLSAYSQFNSIGLVGTASPSGEWDFNDTFMEQDSENPDLWTLDVVLTDGEAKFRADSTWTVNWGSTDFPIGTGIPGGPNIPVRAGQHHITFNSATGEYYFSVVSDIGILGSAAPFGWDEDVNLYQDDTDPDQYSLSLGLSTGAAKFRQDDNWDVNWGSLDFPSGIGTQGGPDIPIDFAGDYNITFNKATGEYNFVLTSFSTVGLIGDATPGGDEPTPMSSGSSPGSWTISLDLADGGVQFSGNDGSAIWGGAGFPSGTAEPDGEPIQVPAGLYVVNFNTKTLAYEFLEVVFYSTIGIIGDATAGGWETDTDMEPEPGNPLQWKLRTILNDGEAKFRADNDWVVNWGAGTFPAGTATRDGANIPVPAGEYIITFNSFTGNYNFQELRIYSAIGLVGTASPSGEWDDNDTFMEKDVNDENLWKLNEVTLSTGEAKFRAEGSWTINWGANSWPTGIGTQGGANIPVTGGTYGVTLNSASGEYAFGDPITSSKDLLNPAAIQVFPNPATETLYINLETIEMTGEVDLKVFDISGKLVLSDVRLADKQVSLPVNTLQPGYYTLHISNDRYIIGKQFSIVK